MNSRFFRHHVFFDLTTVSCVAYAFVNFCGYVTGFIFASVKGTPIVGLGDLQ
jgi:hypothetical protein